MGLFDLPTIWWECKNKECDGKCCSDGQPDPICNLCNSEMERE